MKSHKILLAAVLIALPGVAYGQTDNKKAFEALKGLAGTWVGPVSTVPAMPNMGGMNEMRTTMHVTSRGNGLVHEMQGANNPDDPAKYDHPLTVIYLNDDALTLTHFCDAGNRPRMVAKVSADGKTIDFDFVDIAGPTNHGHMHHARFTFIDADHHTEEWTYMMPNDKSVTAKMAFHREKVATASSGR